MTKIKFIRITTASLAAVVIFLGVFGKLRYGGICFLDFEKISAYCPLGFLERSLAARKLLPQWPYVLLAVLFVVVLGRVFCAWICPTVLIRRVFKIKRDSSPVRASARQERNWASYSSYAFLGSVLLASFWFRFPIFCLFCPIGLFFGFLYAVGRFFSLDSLSLELVLFPLMLILELWVMKSWCTSICPLGALMSLVGKLNHFLIPVSRDDKCFQSKGVNCQVCKRVCPEGIDLKNPTDILAPLSCTKCLQCYEKCPTKAIKIAIFK